ncbi:MAG: hypothetical protein J6Z00_04150 [Clostridia bacterium]|nr:hypothetical protein [Clostridia bacterium]
MIRIDTNLFEKLNTLSTYYHDMKAGKYDDFAIPGACWFVDKRNILSLPRDDGENRYVYGNDGFNFWAYTSGYMHCNDGAFSPFLYSGEGTEPKCAWFVGVETAEGLKTFPLLAAPKANDDVVRYTVFNSSCVTYIAEAYGMRFSVRVFTTADRRMLFTVSSENLSSEKKKFFFMDYLCPHLEHTQGECGETRWFKKINVGKAKGSALPPFEVEIKVMVSRTKQVSNFAALSRSFEIEGGTLLSHEENTSRFQVVGGVHGSLHSFYETFTGHWDNPKQVTVFNDVAVCADSVWVELDSNGKCRMDMQLTYSLRNTDTAPLAKLVEDQITASRVDGLLSEIDADQSTRHEDFQLKFESLRMDNLTEGKLNRFFEHLKKQIEFCAMLKGYAQTGAGSLIGIRDVMQALEAYLVWRPEDSRKKILEAISFTDPSGRCPRQYSLPAYEGDIPRMDVRPFIDQGVWVISTIVTYLKYTGDFSILDEVCGYYEIVNKNPGAPLTGFDLIRLSEEKDTVLDHMRRILEYLIRQIDEETGCVRVLFGDWNDALDGLGVSKDPQKEYGTGVSVMACSQVWQNLNEMVELLSRVDKVKYGEDIARYQAIADKMEKGLHTFGVQTNEKGVKRVTHGWGDQRSYYVGSFCDPDGLDRISSTSLAFWVLTGLLKKSQDDQMRWQIRDDLMSLDTKYGLLTFSHAFAEDVQGVGRINKLPAGTAENGAVYVHASMFAIMALFRMGFAEEAWKELEKALPVSHKNTSLSPFVMPNSYGYNPELNIDGDSMNDWQTGSSNVTVKVFVRDVLGVCPEYDGVWIQPAASGPYEEVSGKVVLHGKTIELSCRKMAGLEDARFFVNGKEQKGQWNETLQTWSLWIPKEEIASLREIIVEQPTKG